MNSKIILVTGGNGLVGKGLQSIVSHQSLSMRDQWFFLSSKDGDLRDLTICRKIFQEKKPTHVIHLAANVGGLYKNMSQPVEMFTDNMLMNMNILQCAHESKCLKVISCLSTCILPNEPPSYPLIENYIHLGPPHSSNEAYAYSKRMIDILNRAYHQEYKSCFTSIVPTNIYGPEDNFHLEDSHVIPGLIHKLYLAQKEGQPFFEVNGTGKPLRQFLFSFDLARILLFLLENYDESEPIIIAPSEEVSISNIVEHLIKISGYQGQIVYNIKKSDGQYQKTASNTKLFSLFQKYNFSFEFTSLEKGLQETWNWFQSQYPNIRR
jgi:GDP-L-fucose synthase